MDTIWQSVLAETGAARTGEGFLNDSLRIQEMIQPYVHPQLHVSARRAFEEGLDQLPNETADAATMFCDMVNFTTIAERKNHDEVVELLSLVMGVVVRTIKRCGDTEQLRPAQ